MSKSAVSTPVKPQTAAPSKTSVASSVVHKPTAVPKAAVVKRTTTVQRQQRLQQASTVQNSGFIPVETAVTKQLNRTDVRRNVQVTDIPPIHLHSKIAPSTSYTRVPHAYEALKKVSRPRVNRHPFAYQQLMGLNPK